MARTWTLFDTIAVDVPNIPSRALVKDGLLYFRTTESIYEWDGATATQIASSSTFPNSPIGGSSAVLADLCVFNDDLFVGIVYNDGNDPDEVYRHVSSTTWAQDAVLEDEDAVFPYPHFATNAPTNTEGRYFLMDCDATYMFMAVRQVAGAGATLCRYIARNTSGVYVAATMPGGGYDSPQPQLVGLSKGSRHSFVVGVQRVGADNYRAIQRGSPNFSDISGADVGDRRLIGYADGKSFWSLADGGNWELRYSTDWGVNLTAAGNVEHPGTGNRSGFAFKDCGDEAIMMAVSEADEQVYVWDPGTDTFVADGTITAGATIYDFFVFNGGLYLLSSSSTANSADIWYGGQLTSAAFYYGRGNLQNRVALPFSFLNIGGLAVAYPVAILGAGVSGSPMVSYAGPADDYASFTDFTGALGTDPIQAFDATPWGDAAAATESGEDTGPGGGLSNGKC